MWYCEDTAPVANNDNEDDDDVNTTTPTTKTTTNAFVYQKNGLFPAAYPPSHENLASVLDYFSFMGIFLAKSLQDQRLVDMPFSYPFLKVICAYKEEPRRGRRRHRDEAADDAAASGLFDDLIASQQQQQHKETTTSDDIESSADDPSRLDLDGILNLDDLCLIDPHRGSLLKQLREILDERKEKGISNDDENSEDIYVDLNGSKVCLDDLG